MVATRRNYSKSHGHCATPSSSTIQEPPSKVFKNYTVKKKGDLENSFLVPTYKGQLDDDVLSEMTKVLLAVASDSRSSTDVQTVIDEVKDQFGLH